MCKAMPNIKSSPQLSVIMILIFMILEAGNVFAQDRSEEYALKAVLLNRLAGFVTWPGSTSQTAQDFCVAGSNPFNESLISALDDSKLTVAHLISKETSVSDCRILFISDSELRDFQDWLTLTKNKPILTVSDIPRFAEQGGMINLTFENRRVRFRINNNVASREKLKLSYQLLNLSVIVESDAGALGESN